jgi:hypothetical protein
MAKMISSPAALFALSLAYIVLVDYNGVYNGK